MAIMYLALEPFTLTSSWTSSGHEAANPIYTAPSTVTAFKHIEASALPTNCTIQSAILHIEWRAGYSGGVLTVNGTNTADLDVTELLTASEGGIYGEIPLTFTYRAFGYAGWVQAVDHVFTHTSIARIDSAIVAVTYEGGTGGIFDAVAYRAAALSDNRHIQPRGMLTFKAGATQPITAEQIVSFSIDEGDDSGILFGAATSSLLNMELANASCEWLYGGAMRGNRNMIGSTLKMEIGLDVGGAWQWRSAGVFVIDEISGSEQSATIRIHGYDAMKSKLSELYHGTALSYPATMTQLLTHIVAQSGLSLSGVLACNRTIQLQSMPEWSEKCTLRNALAFVCEACASHAYITRDGGIGIGATWRTNDPLEIGTSDYLTKQYNEHSFAFNRIVINPTGQGENAVNSAINANAEEKDYNTLYIKGNPIFKTEAIAQQFAGGIRDALAGAVWTAIDAKWRGDPSVIIGTPLILTDRRGVENTTTIMYQKLKWQNGFSMDARCGVKTYVPTLEIADDAEPISNLAVGSTVLLMEDALKPWTLVSTDYNGSGNCLLLADAARGQSTFGRYSSANTTKYDGSELDNYINELYNALPADTKAIIEQTFVPVRASAQSNTQNHLQRYMFTLSRQEIDGNGSAMEGAIIPYRGGIAIGSNYWTREVIGGMTNYVYYANASGEVYNDNAAQNKYVRPCLCVSPSLLLTQTENGYIIASQ